MVTRQEGASVGSTRLGPVFETKENETSFN